METVAYEVQFSSLLNSGIAMPHRELFRVDAENRQHGLADAVWDWAKTRFTAQLVVVTLSIMEQRGTVFVRDEAAGEFSITRKIS